ncbi:SMI1/KNR4 family protein [Saccharibacillus sp. O23]|uniref:SMI1/KNR4 family protein n=1 Tax=Saccharibacillus sp. O23 TaxID=2009338 RepID=UPI000B7544B5|nr:SMI1/KNR4 family protein [Saccharibacillus sp. O23]OWR27753.1 SMI1/KNR4 family protein [Saccharibacillus sp. O23]
MSEADIRREVPDEFPGKDFFVEFYASRNGGYFSRGAFLRRDAFYEVGSDEENRLEVEAFNCFPLREGDESPVLLSIPQARQRRMRHWAAFGLADFVETHLPFAGDAGDHDYWLDLRDGTVKTVRWNETDGALVPAILAVAPGFREFCTSLAAERT